MSAQVDLKVEQVTAMQGNIGKSGGSNTVNIIGQAIDMEKEIKTFIQKYTSDISLKKQMASKQEWKKSAGFDIGREADKVIKAIQQEVKNIKVQERGNTPAKSNNPNNRSSS